MGTEWGRSPRRSSDAPGGSAGARDRQSSFLVSPTAGWRPLPYAHVLSTIRHPMRHIRPFALLLFLSAFAPTASAQISTPPAADSSATPARKPFAFGFSVNTL